MNRFEHWRADRNDRRDATTSAQEHNGLTRAIGNAEPPDRSALMSGRRSVATMAADSGAWALALVVAATQRYDFQLGAVRWERLGTAVLVTIVLAITAGVFVGTYRGRWRLGSFEEMAAVGKTTAVVGAVLILANLPLRVRLLPLGASIVGPVAALALMGAYRYVLRLAEERHLRPREGQAERIVVFGAGEAGAMIVTSLMRNPDSRYLPVAILDDDPTKRNLHISGVTVQGDRRHMVEVARRQGARTVLMAIPSASATVIRSLVEVAEEGDLKVTVLPSVQELVGGTVSPADIRPVTEADLLGRRAIDTDVAAIADYLNGRVVLVTGAGGSIGSELCRQLHNLGPARLLMLDRDESALHAVQLSIEGRALLDSGDLLVADIRDRERVFELFEELRPDVVFHAAALKHLTLLELNGREGVKTNVWGTQNLLDASRHVGVQKFVNVSTDKAANPESVLGFTKRIAERLTAHAADATGRPYLSVRFGNVLGSRGSVVPTFKAQIDAGQPVTVTHPEVTRFFMTIEEAVQLVIQAGAIGAGGQVLILDMGEPVKIVDVARRLLAASHSTLPIVYTGLRPGEKLHEMLIDADELAVPSSHPLITQAQVSAVDPLVLAGVLPVAAGDRLKERLRAAALLAPHELTRLDLSPNLTVYGGDDGSNPVSEVSITSRSRYDSLRHIDIESTT